MLFFADLNTTGTADFPEPLPVENYIKKIPLPMDRVINDLSPQQRLAVYEHVIQVRVCVLRTLKYCTPTCKFSNIGLWFFFFFFLDFEETCIASKKWVEPRLVSTRQNFYSTDSLLGLRGTSIHTQSNHLYFGSLHITDTQLWPFGVRMKAVPLYILNIRSRFRLPKGEIES